MAVIRVQHTKNYTVMSNYHLRDKTISLKAKGLMSQMLSLPDDWDYTVDGLVAINVEQRSAIVSALKELKSAGYLVVTMAHQADSGHFDYVYDLYEQPLTDLPMTENPYTDNPVTDNPMTENLSLNKYKEESNTDLQNTDGRTARFRKPTVDEIRAYCRERNNNVDPERFFDYYESKGWKVGKAPMKDWRASVRTWERGDKQESGGNDGQRKMMYSTNEYDEMFERNLERSKRRTLRGGAENFND